MGRQPLIVLRGASLSVGRGEFLAVSGASGSGKSTLLHILGALDVPDDGRVVLNGTDLFALPQSGREHVRCHSVGFVFQFYHLLPELNLLENTLLPCMVGSSLVRWFADRVVARRAAEEILSRVGLSHRLRHRPNELSGGERQRAAIARALVNTPKLLLADEPTGNLDAKTGQTILDLLRELNEQGQTIVMVTHDARTAGYAKRRVLLEDGRIKAA
jgi:ABC-type lipoprotein export system ATPase subunit